MSLQTSKQRTEWALKRLGKTALFYPSFAASEEMLAAFAGEWAVLLDEIGPEKFEQALTTHIRSSQFFPTVAELRKAAGATGADAEQAEALKQWAWLKRFLHRNYYEDLDGLRHKDQIPERTLEALRICGGARRIYFIRDQDEPFEQKRFLEAYRLADKTAEPVAQKQLGAGE